MTAIKANHQVGLTMSSEATGPWPGLMTSGQDRSVESAANCLKLGLARNYADILTLVFSSSCSHGLSGFLVPRRALLFWGIFVRGFARRDLC